MNFTTPEADFVTKGGVCGGRGHKGEQCPTPHSEQSKGAAV